MRHTGIFADLEECHEILTAMKVRLTFLYGRIRDLRADGDPKADHYSRRVKIAEEAHRKVLALRDVLQQENTQ